MSYSPRSSGPWAYLGEPYDPPRRPRARRAATRDRLIGEGATEETADAWIAAWEAQAAQDGLERGADYWDAGWNWIAAERRKRSDQ